MQHSVTFSIVRAVREALGLLVFATARPGAGRAAAFTPKPKKTTKTV
jgi:hypothetical protein